MSEGQRDLLREHASERQLGQLIAGDESAYTYLPESTLAFLEPDRLAGVLRDAGLIDVRVRPVALGTVAVTSARKPKLKPG